jgi:hypothetical protein
VERCHDGRFQFAQQRQHVAAGRSAKNPKLVLQANNPHVANVNEVGGPLVGRQVRLLDLEANYVRVLVAALDVIDRYGEALALGVLRCHGRKQIGCERGDPALARHVVAEERDPSNLRFCFHELLPIVPCPRKTRTLEPDAFERKTTQGIERQRCFYPGEE